MKVSFFVRDAVRVAALRGVSGRIFAEMGMKLILLPMNRLSRI
jgi:hypothetical protein